MNTTLIVIIGSMILFAIPVGVIFRSHRRDMRGMRKVIEKGTNEQFCAAVGIACLLGHWGSNDDMRANGVWLRMAELWFEPFDCNVTPQASSWRKS